MQNDYPPDDFGLLAGTLPADDDDITAYDSIYGTQERRVMPYNFRRPRLFAQDQMRVLSHVHEAFARDLAVYLSAQLRTIVDIRLTATDQVLYSEYVMSSAPPSALYVVDIDELNHKVVVEIDPRLVVYTIEKLFGGPGVFLRQPREVSQIERRIMSKVMARAYRLLESAWRQVYTFRMEESAFESNAEFVQIIPGVEPALVCTFEVVIYEQPSFINICYPYIVLDRMMGRTGMKQWISNATSEVPPPIRNRYEEKVRELDVQLRAELGRARLPVSELSQLEEGDVIPLQRRVAEPVRIFVGNQEKFLAQAGKSGRRRALRITELVETKPPQEDDEN